MMKRYWKSGAAIESHPRADHDLLLDAGEWVGERKEGRDRIIVAAPGRH
jgi:hypothetical protein